MHTKNPEGYLGLDYFTRPFGGKDWVEALGQGVSPFPHLKVEAIERGSFHDISWKLKQIKWEDPQ